ncbi:PH and SEC7 domain-containing protein 4 [Elgaria multicarinata webbii]|uniref:PH and SEC7 domain-containing protein 4 n=1 Tax=Elgaria multicarinata webbii TaxID=159646 RepID=UPI002FCCC35A
MRAGYTSGSPGSDNCPGGGGGVEEAARARPRKELRKAGGRAGGKQEICGNCSIFCKQDEGRVGLPRPSQDVSMVSPRMEHSGPSNNLDLMDLKADGGGRGELSSDPGQLLGVAQALLTPEASSLPFFTCPENVGSLQDRLEDVCSGTGISSEKPLPASAQLLSEDLQCPESLKTQDKSNHDTTQALFWASILQAQMCVLDLQGEIDRQKEPLKISSLSPERVPVMAVSRDSVASCEPLFLDSDSGEEPEESLEGQEEESSSEEEEEVEYIFYNNPLFQDSPRPTRTISSEGSSLWGHPEGKVSAEEDEGIVDSALVFRDRGDHLFCQTCVATSPEAMDFCSEVEPGARDDLPPGPFPSYLPHCRSLSPLVITEGDVEGACPSAEVLEAQGCFPEQLAYNPSRGLLESNALGESHCVDSPPAQGLLFSASSTSLLSALVQEPRETCPPPQPPSPAEITRSAGSFSAPAAEQTLWQEKFRPQVPSLSGAWAGQPERTSCLQEEVALPDLHSVSLGGVDRKLESSTEGLEMVDLAPAHGNKILEGEQEEPPLCCPEELWVEPSSVAESLPEKGLVEPGGELFANGTSGDQAAALRLANRLYHLDGIKRSQVAAFLRKNNDFSQMVAEGYLSFFHFSRQTLDQALRSFLKAFVLTGESQERERILRHFSQRYHSCNPEAFISPDAAHTLTCAIMLLNTDLHGQHIGRSMTCQDFLANLDGLNDGLNFPKELLKALYYSIRHEKLEWAEDDEEPVGSQTLQASASSSSLSGQKKSNPFLNLLHDPGAKTYRQGLLSRKVHAEADGKKTPWGKRGWKMFHTVLKGTVLYFFKDEGRPDASGSEEPIGVHHALAEKASQYTKRPHVFRLQTADWRIFLFQALTSEEMSSWISRINLVAAMFSSPPFPAAVGSQRKFVRPILPTVPCKTSLEDQHLAHESCMDKVSDELLEHQRNLPDKRGRGRDLEEYQLKKEYLLYEKRRYEMYVRLLELKLSSATEDLDQWEARLGEAAETDPGLHKSHSSPSLNVEGLPTGVKVKRNISERRTVRKIIPRRNKHLL